MTKSIQKKKDHVLKTDEKLKNIRLSIWGPSKNIQEYSSKNIFESVSSSENEMVLNVNEF